MPESSCPHCGRPAISEWRRATLGPVAITQCRECGLAVSVPWWSIVVTLPISVSIIFARLAYCDHSAVFAVAAASGIATTVVAYRFIPLVKR